MTRYIDADELYTEGYCLVRDIHINGALLRDSRSLLDVPTEDVQPVVRCKDCKWCVDANGLMCKNVKSWVIATELSFGCVYGERKDGEQNGSID